MPGMERSRYDLAILIMRARLQLQRREWSAGLATCESGLEVADRRNDRLRGSILCVLGADVLIEMQRLRARRPSGLTGRRGNRKRCRLRSVHRSSASAPLC